jgi:hypothetical protein
MFKGFNNRQQNGFPNLSFFGDRTAYGQGGCNFWLRADFGLNTQTNLGAVSSWTDYVSGINFAQATAANQPRLLTSSASYNNLPIVEFQDNQRVLERISTISGFRSIAFIANYDFLNSRNTIMGSGTLSAIVLGGTITNINGVSVLSSSTITSGTTENTNVKICVISENFIMVNGISENTSSNNLQNISYDKIGAGDISGANRLIGKVAEIIGYSTAITTDQALALSNNINSKYAIY